MSKTAGDGGEDLTLTLNEHTAASGGSSQALAKIVDVFTKMGADITAIGQFTKTTQAAASTWTDAASGEADLLLAFTIDAEALSNGFEFVSLDTNDPGTGTAQYVCILAILHNGRYLSQVAPSAIA